MFLDKLDTHTTIKDRAFPLLVLRIPISFDPSNQEHLREIEAINNLPIKSVGKARWIKPIYRRHPNQKATFATLTIASASKANRLIRDGMTICGTRTFPKRLKYEPRQCMKCRKWGHYTAECRANINTCRTCSGDHMTKECDEPDRRYCVSCRSDEHASWDRVCPEFQRKSAHFDEIHPENALTYFPTEEEWTHNARPDRIPLQNRFPAKLATRPPLVQQQKPKPRPTATPSHKQRGCTTEKIANTQGTLDRFVESCSRERPIHPPASEDEDEEEEREADSLIQTSPRNQ